MFRLDMKAQVMNIRPAGDLLTSDPLHREVMQDLLHQVPERAAMLHPVVGLLYLMRSEQVRKHIKAILRPVSERAATLHPAVGYLYLMRSEKVRKHIKAILRPVSERAASMFFPIVYVLVVEVLLYPL